MRGIMTIISEQVMKDHEDRLSKLSELYGVFIVINGEVSSDLKNTEQINSIDDISSNSQMYLEDLSSVNNKSINGKSLTMDDPELWRIKKRE